MTYKELEQYLLQCLNMALGSQIEGETSYTNSFDVKVGENGFLFIPRLPSSYVIDDSLYQKIFLIANAALYPSYTVLKQNSAYFVPLDSPDIHTQRALYFPWKRGNDILVIHPEKNRSKSDFVSQINEKLSQALELIYTRQGILFENSDYKFDHLTIVIDEVLALNEGTNKAIKDSFFSLLSQIALLGRATKVHLLLVSQRFDYNSIPVSVREQLNVNIQIGNINNKTVQFLFPDLSPEGIVIPAGRGTGLIQIIDNEHPFQVLPLLCPTYYTKKGIL